MSLKASAGTNNNQQSSRVSGPRRLSTKEWADRQRKGLCFKCGERWGPDHVCKLKHYQIYILEDSEATESEESLIRQQENQGENELELEKLKLQLSSYSYWGLTTHKTFKVKGKIQDREVIILIDPRASTNFITTRIVQELQLSTTRIREFQVEVGNGTIKKGNLGCERVKIEVQEIQIIQSFFVMELGKTEVVLGARWMASLGKFVGDYNEMMISWKVEEKNYVLRGDPSLSRSKASYKATLNALKGNEERYLVTPIFLTDVVKDNPQLFTGAQRLLQEYEDLFQEPYRLLHQRDHDHAITLKEGA